MGINVTLRGGSGDMLKATYDPDLDGKIAHGQIEDDYIEEGDLKRDVVIKDTASDTFASKVAPPDYIDGTVLRLAAKLTPSEEYIKTFSVNLRHQGAALTHSAVNAVIRKVSDDSVLVTKHICYRDDEVSTTVVEYNVTFDTPAYVDCEVYLSVESAGGSVTDEIGCMGISAGGAGNIYKYEAGAWAQVNAVYDMYFVLDYYKQTKAVKIG